MTMTVAIAQSHLDAWLAADLAVARNQSYSISTGSGSRSLSRADVAEISEQITKWQRAVNTLTAQAAGNSNPGIKVATWS